MREGTPLRAGVRSLHSGRGWEWGDEKKTFIPPGITLLSSSHRMTPSVIGASRNDSCHLIEMYSSTLELLALTVLFRLKCAPARWNYSQ
jgi:hypothetical protein